MRIRGLDVALSEVLKVLDIIQGRHDLERDEEGRTIPTVAFLRDLSDALSSYRKLTSAECWQVWRITLAYADEIRIRHEQDAEIAFWYGFNPFGLTEEQRIGLYENLPRVKAQQRIELGKFNPEDWDGVYDLVLLATGSENEAVRARGDAQELHVKRETARARK